jgi:hemerythrin-like domain-containing protein
MNADGRRFLAAFIGVQRRLTLRGLNVMQPIGPLMIEHRLIERLLTLMAREFKRIKDNVAVDPEFAFVDPVFIDTAMDFLHTYAGRCHHGKEEDLLFKALAEKNLSPEHRQIVEELIQEHAWAREATAGLVKAKEAYLLEKPGALDELMEQLGKLVEFYPRHIDKEDKHFFIPCMTYFSDAEQADLLARMQEFDRQLIHEKYRGVVESMEQRRGCKSCSLS